MKKIDSVVLAALTVGFLLVSCGPKSKDSSKETYIYTDVSDGTAYYVNTKNYGELTATVTVPETHDGKKITVIDEKCLEGATEVTKVELPESVRQISYYAFNKCEKLAEINLPSALRSVEREAFAGTALTEVCFPAGLETLGGYVFKDCKSLTTVNLPATLKTIGIGVFEGCENLESVSFGGTEEAWAKVTKGDLKLPEGVTVSFLPDDMNID